MARKAINVLVGASLKPLQKTLKKGVGLIKGFGDQASKAIAGSGGIKSAIAGLFAGASFVAGMKLALNKFSEIESASVKLSATLKQTGNQAGVSTAQVLGFAKQMQAATGIATASTMEAAAAVAKVANIKGPNFQETIRQAANFAAVMGGDVVSASNTLASALKNPREGYLELAAAGVRFSEDQIDAIQSMQALGDVAGAQAVILEAVKLQMDGAAEAAGNTLSGSFDKLWGSISDVAAVIGEQLAPFVKAAADLFTEWAATFDTIETKNAIVANTAVAVGWVVDGMQILNASWKTAEALIGALVSSAITGFKWLAQGVQIIVEGLEYIGAVSEGASQSIKSFVDGVAEYEKASWDATKQSALSAADAWQKPWKSESTDKFFNKVTEHTKKSEDAMKGLGASVVKGPVAAMKQLSTEAIEAQKSATSMIKDMKLQLDNFGLADWEAKANELQKKGATKGQVADVKRLGAMLEGKQLAQSLETPFEKFEREAAKLERLAQAGGIGGVDLERAKAKLASDLQASAPELKLNAGGPLMAGSQEARSAIMSYRNQSRAADPQVALQRQAEIQSEELKLIRQYMKKLADAKPTTSAFAAL